MKNNALKKFLLGGFFALAVFSATLSDAFGQTKTATFSPCVDLVAPNANTINQIWANVDFQPCRQAVGSLRAASLIVLGRNLEKNNSMDDYTLQEWLLDIGMKPAWKAKFDDGLKFTDATAYIRETAKPSQYFFSRIFQEIYGRDPEGFEKLFYGKAIETKEMWYATIFSSARENLNKKPAEREKMINRAFQAAKKRDATGDEMKYWKPRTEIYRDVLQTIKK